MGRQLEMAELKASLEDALSGRGRLVMLVGEPGIGKTRTSLELSILAQGIGFNILWGRCYEDEGAPPYWPWLQAIRSYVRECDARRLESELGYGAADIADVVPEIKSKVTGIKPLPPLEPEAARFRLFDSITTFLKNAAQVQPIMLVLDDLHWADRSTILLLEFLVRELGESRFLVVGCYREVEMAGQRILSETLANLSREPVFRRQSLSGLKQQDTGPFVEAVAGVQISRESAATLYAQTEGNPFFLTEAIRLLAERGELESHPAEGLREIQLTQGVREVIGQRLRQLSEACNQALSVASLIGREFDFNLLVSLSEEDTEDRVLEALEEALAASVIQEPPRTIGRYQFTHALIQETLKQELSTARRARLHARIGHALEDLYGANAKIHAAELAYHFAQAEMILGPSKLAGYSLLAGEEALASHAYEDALAYFERGLAARNIPLSGLEVALDEEAAALLFGLGRAQQVTLPRHRLAEVGTTIRPAFDYYVRVGDVPRALSITEYIGGRGLSRGPNAVGILTEALNLVPVGSLQSGRILTRYADVLDSSLGESNAAIDALDQALEIAQRENDGAMEFQVLAMMSRLHYMHLNYQKSLERCLRAIELMPRISRPVDAPVFGMRCGTSLA